MNIIEFLNQIWTQILDVTALFVTPDWGFLISMLPVMVLLGLVMPFLTGLAILTVAYLVTKPRAKVAFEEGPRLAEIGPGGEPVFPVGLPHCRRDALVYPSGTLRCDTCHDELAVICPMCGLGRVGAHRHLLELRSRPQGQDPSRGRPDDGWTQARWRRRRLT